MLYTRQTSRFYEIEHTADIGLTGEGDTLPALFASLAFGMLQIITKTEIGAGEIACQIDLEEPALDGLLIRWLSEINFYLMVKHFLPSSIPDLKINETPDHCYLSARLSGSDITVHQDLIETEIKAVTYHQLTVTRRENGYSARVIFDI